MTEGEAMAARAVHYWFAMRERLRDCNCRFCELSRVHDDPPAGKVDNNGTPSPDSVPASE